MAEYLVVSRGIGRNPPSRINLLDTHAAVELNRGLEAHIDIADVPELAGYAWRALIHNETGRAYAYRLEKGKCILMHRHLLSPTPSELVDHVDGNGLNNKRCNIRICTYQQNAANRVVDRINRLGLKGVQKSDGRYLARIQHKGRQYRLGGYDTPEEAAAAFRGAAIILNGEFAR